jgi:hypothetical protein
VQGTVDVLGETAPTIVDLFGRKAIVLEFSRTQLKEIFKVEWIW